VERKIKDAMRAGTLEKGRIASRVDAAVAAGVISEAEEARWDAVQVDAFGEVRMTGEAQAPMRSPA